MGRIGVAQATVVHCISIMISGTNLAGKAIEANAREGARSSLAEYQNQFLCRSKRHPSFLELGVATKYVQLTNCDRVLSYDTHFRSHFHPDPAIERTLTADPE